MKTKFLILLLWYFVNTSAQQIFNPVGAEAWSVGGSSVSSQNIFSVFNNPATFSAIKKFQGGVYSERRFSEGKMSIASMAFVAPFKWINIGFSINHFGYGLFNQQKISLSFSKQLFRNFSLGATFGYFGTTISEQTPAGNFLGELGLLYQPFSKWHLGLFIFNPTQAKYSQNSYDRIPTYARMGIGYDVSEKVKLLAETEQMLDQNTVFRVGIKYQIHEVLSLSVGAADHPVYYTFGTGIKLKTFKVDFAASVHEVLGVTPHLSISFPVGQ